MMVNKTAVIFYSSVLALFVIVFTLFELIHRSRPQESVSSPVILETPTATKSETSSSQSSYDKSQCRPGGACLSPEEAIARICAVALKEPSHVYYQDCKQQGY